MLNISANAVRIMVDFVQCTMYKPVSLSRKSMMSDFGILCVAPYQFFPYDVNFLASHFLFLGSEDHFGCAWSFPSL